MRRKHTILLLVVAVIIGSVPTTLGAVGDSDVTTDTEVGPDVRAISEQGEVRALAQETPNNTSVTFENQTSNGTVVTIQQVYLADGGFVAIHDRGLLNASVLGSVIGVSQHLEPGVHENVTVRLNESMNESQQLLALAYRDTNANQEFDFVASNGDVDGAYEVDGQVVVDSAYVTVEEVPETTTTTTTPEETTTETTAETITPTATVETTTIQTTPGETTTEETPTTTETTTAETTETTTTTTATTTTEETTTTEDTTTTSEVPTETTTTEEPVEAPSLRVTDLNVPQTIVLNEGQLVVNARVENPSDETVTETVQLRVNGDVVTTKSVDVDPGETAPVQFKIDRTDLDVEPGEAYVEVFTSEFGESVSVTVKEEGETTTTEEPPETTTEAQAAGAASLSVSSLDAPGSFALNGDTLVVNAEVRNPTDSAVTATVQLRAGDTVVDERQIEVGPDETNQIEFEVAIEDLGLGLLETLYGVFTGNFGQDITVTVDSSGG